MDELLLRRAREGDPEAFERLMTPLEGLIWRVCWHYMGERQAAEDCGQEAMLRIWRSLASYREDSGLESWVYRIAANCCLDALRKRKREQALSVENLAEQGFDPPDPKADTEGQVIAGAEQARLREAIALLPEEQRDALILTQLEGLSYERTAQLLGVSEGTVKSRINRAKARLREMLTEEKKGSAGRELSPAAFVQRKGGRIRS